jgi:dihydroneopterin aldolase
MSDAHLAPVGAVWSSRHITWSQTTLFVESLQVETAIGGYPHEEGRLQPIWIDLEIMLRADFDSAGNDELVTPLDYDWAVNQVLKAIGEVPGDLLESLARRIADTLLGHPLADVVKLRIAKLGAIPGARVGLRLQADRGPTPELRVLL